MHSFKVVSSLGSLAPNVLITAKSVNSFVPNGHNYQLSSLVREKN